MKPGLEPGYQEKMSIVVREDMVASFGGQMVHPVLSTVSLVYYMEWTGRKVILPFLEEDEEGVGASINIRHRAPAPVGKTVTFVATVKAATPQKVVCEVIAEHDRAIVGEGEFVQVIIPKEKLKAQIERMR
ncbi:thioesterase family protein [Thermoactinomyces mirandus]|uniref:Thioesterase family protein n=1 Tax=Thermoactinomyces mirandus TaxID=2756294 RepID=A0A7W2AQE9_9BACL|nr:thioesterase family protein [Thermoactinomyces mirandus]MBA4601894.1 thioesterase family protein [Thermoactinomyces mirandus]